MVCRCFLPLRRLSFHFVDDFLCCSEAFRFDVVSFTCFCFCSLYFECHIKKIIAMANVRKIFVSIICYLSYLYNKKLQLMFRERTQVISFKKISFSDQKYVKKKLLSKFHKLCGYTGSKSLISSWLQSPVALKLQASMMWKFGPLFLFILQPNI